MLSFIKKFLNRNKVVAVQQDTKHQEAKKSHVHFATWVQDNYSQSVTDGNRTRMLPKGKMRKDFTRDIYTMDEIWDEYITRNQPI